MPIVLIDCDGPLTRGFTDKACAVLQSLGVAAQYQNVKFWDLSRSFTLDRDVSEELWKQLRAPSVAYDFAPNHGVEKFLSRLREMAYVVCVTAPLLESPTWAFDRTRWLTERLCFSPSEIVLATNKSHVMGDVLIDDHEGNLRRWQRRHPTSEVIMWAEPANEQSNFAGHRTDSYDVLIEHLRKKFA
jgi:5'(3')-deoxyribonucleotidase